MTSGERLAVVVQLQRLIDAGELPQAVSLGRAALQQAAGAERAEVLMRPSAAHVASGQLLDGLRCAVEAAEHFKLAEQPGSLCDALNQLATAQRAAGDHAAAIMTLEPAEDLARSQGDALRVARVLRNIGVCSSLLGRHQHALSCLSDAYDLFCAHAPREGERLNARISLLNAHNRRLELVTDADEKRRLAEHLLGEWTTLAATCADEGMVRLELMALGNRAITLQPAGRPAEAVAELQALLERYRTAGMLPNEGLCHAELGRAHESLGQLTPSREHYRAAVYVQRSGGHNDDLVESLDGLSRTEEALGDPVAALAALRELRAIERRRSDDAARHAIAQRELRIELSRLTSHWAQLAAQDPLTGLGNRRALDRWLDEQMPRVEQGEPLAMLLLDLDHFKHVNDHHGHEIGDEVLRRVAGLLRRHTRSGDIAVRYGGEEFLLAMAGVERSAADSVAHRLHDAVARHAWHDVVSGLAVTVSVGVADAREVMDASALITLADRRLYAAKFLGRNRVVLAG